MTAQEMARILSGPVDQQRKLFEELLTKAISIGLDDDETVIFETLKKLLVRE